VAGETPKPHRVTQRVSETFISESGYGEYKFCTEAYFKSDNMDLSTLKTFCPLKAIPLFLDKKADCGTFMFTLTSLS